MQNLVPVALTDFSARGSLALWGKLWRKNKKALKSLYLLDMLAEAVRFELTNGFPLPVFKTGAIDHSATLPSRVCLSKKDSNQLFRLQSLRSQ